MIELQQKRANILNCVNLIQANVTSMGTPPNLQLDISIKQYLSHSRDECPQRNGSSRLYKTFVENYLTMLDRQGYDFARLRPEVYVKLIQKQLY